ncbi:dienelactone hydrolase [Hygrophoropsis aurantiaca]|uniref:Dienelactone hydrolase n=1 Tax=Hygrophoropsis aurantiaca TaxID=72124 RepID=A0ACB8AIZ4_9AGAM|nr:dienelactone hydrolase [Hygrophoropsis aurantiaca]
MSANFQTTTGSPVLAGAPGSCCITGVKHTGTPMGRTEQIGGMETYVSELPTQKTSRTNIILFFADVFGPMWINNKLVQDFFAVQGFTVLGPDYFFGFGVVNHPKGYDTNGWISTAVKPAWDAFSAWIDAVKKYLNHIPLPVFKSGTENVTYCAVGYCFGGPFVMHLAAEDWITACAMAHPAFLEESHFEKQKEADENFPTESRHRAEAIMAEHKGTYYFQLFSHVNHGFAVRIELECWAKEESARAVKEWFVRFTE